MQRMERVNMEKINWIDFYYTWNYQKTIARFFLSISGEIEVKFGDDL